MILHYQLTILKKTFRFITKMALPNELNIFGDQIRKQINLIVIQIKNQLKSLELSSKYNCLIGEDLGYASGVAEQT